MENVSGNANQAVANGDFEGYVREANKADIEAKFGRKDANSEMPESQPTGEKDAPKAAPVEGAGAKREKSPGAMHYKELRDTVRAQEAEIARLRAAARGNGNEQAEEVEVAKPAAKQSARPTSSDKKENGETKYGTWEEYEDALLAWNTERIMSQIDARSAKQAETAAIEAANRTMEQTWNERVTKSRETHVDYDEVALDSEKGPASLIGHGSLVDRWLLESEHGAELLYHFGKHPEDLLQFGKVNGAADAYRRLAKLEEKIAASPKEQPVREAAEEPRISKTPKPAAEVGGRGSRLPDAVSAAVADGSEAAVGRYIEEMNRREIRAKFGDRR